MRTRIILATASVIALVAGTTYYAADRGPPIMTKEGETTVQGLLTVRRTVDYETIIKTALTNKASFLTMTVSEEVVRDRELSKSIKYTSITASRARVRVKYRAEYPIGYVLSPGRFSVAMEGDDLVITLSRPQLIAKPSVTLLSHTILDLGFFLDEKTAVIELQQRIQPDVERRAARILSRPTIVPRSEQALRGFLTPLLAQSADGDKPPTIKFRYR